MPLLQNTKLILNKYDLKSYSPLCNNYTIYTEENIFFVIVNEKERGDKSMKDIAEQFYHNNKKHACIRGGYVGSSLKEFDVFLAKYFKLKYPNE